MFAYNEILHTKLIIYITILTSYDIWQLQINKTVYYTQGQGGPRYLRTGGSRVTSQIHILF